MNTPYINKNVLAQFDNVKNIAIAIDKELKYIDGCIAYDLTNKEPICSLINSIYWNGSNTGKRFNNGKEIVKNYTFIHVNENNYEEIHEIVKDLHYWLNNLNKKNAGRMCDFYEDNLYRYSKVYKK